MVRPIALVENYACGEEVAATANPAQTVPNQEIPCCDTGQLSEIAGSGHHCPCSALIQPKLANMITNTDSFSLYARDTRSVETAVAVPPIPPPRLV